MKNLIKDILSILLSVGLGVCYFALGTNHDPAWPWTALGFMWFGVAGLDIWSVILRRKL